MPASQPACKNAVSLPNQIMRTKVAEYEGEKRVVLSLKREPAPPLTVFNYTTRHDRPTDRDKTVLFNVVNKEIKIKCRCKLDRTYVPSFLLIEMT